MSILPKCWIACSARCRKSSLLEMLAGIAIAAPAPLTALMAWATSAHGSGLRDEITTCAPCSAMRSAIALPMPRDEPVITATFPARENKDMGRLLEESLQTLFSDFHSGSVQSLPR